MITATVGGNRTLVTKAAIDCILYVAGPMYVPILMAIPLRAIVVI